MKQAFSADDLDGLFKAISEHAKENTLTSASIQIQHTSEESAPFSVEYGVAVLVEGKRSILIIQTPTQLEELYHSQP